MHQKQLVTAGKPLQKAERALILVHGRGANARDILSLADYLNVPDFALLAPAATNHTWYPFSFMAPQAANEPWLSSALAILESVFDDATNAGIAPGNIYLGGFSQGACLALEFAARQTRKPGGVLAFSGGLIGQEIDRSNYQTNFEQTPIFIGCSDVDPHIPRRRVEESGDVLSEMNAAVTVHIYPGMGHTVNDDELQFVNEHILPL
ncbi:MAG TPA: dienelactone hydrolase family protein [Saprospiraceae bacterium]|mgnify:CR=1 FL=1|nr:dienelactone hydrolase family protein [Saprospiraceae bacterium]HMP22740.1 dienelactone hydrolase family protein [Saprospiraceae bacterium]